MGREQENKGVHGQGQAVLSANAAARAQCLVLDNINTIGQMVCLELTPHDGRYECVTTFQIHIIVKPEQLYSIVHCNHAITSLLHLSMRTAQYCTLYSTVPCSVVNHCATNCIQQSAIILYTIPCISVQVRPTLGLLIKCTSPQHAPSKAHKRETRTCMHQLGPIASFRG